MAGSTRPPVDHRARAPRAAVVAPAVRALAMVAAALSFMSCRSDERAGRLVELGGPTMGSTWAVKIVAPPDGVDEATRREIDRAVADELARLDALVSTWNRDSELSRFNRSSTTDPFPVAAETFDLFAQAIALSDETGGALDVTVAPLVDAWGFGPSGDVPPPDESTVARLLEATGSRHLELDPEGRWVRKRRPDVQCDFSAIAPGYAADRVGDLLARQGFADFLVDVGGELLARGRNDAGSPWQVAIERPMTGGRAIARIVPVTNLAVATSGDYRNYHEVNGERVAHIVDPRTGRPIRHRLASATVITGHAGRADGLSTALMVLGTDEGLALAERLGIAALFLVRAPDGTFEERASSQFERLSKGAGI
jgi:thiamine biosynthesis lipoprotein